MKDERERNAQDYVDSGRWDWAGGFGRGGADLEAAGAATGVAFEWHRYAAGADAFEKTGEYIPKALYESIEENRVALKGPVTTPIGGGFASINVTLRQKFELFANFRPVKSLPGLKTKLSGDRHDHRAREHGGSVRGAGA